MDTEISQDNINNEKQNHGTDLTTGSIPRHLIAFSMPMLIGSLLQTAYSIINAVWVGNGLGTNAMAALTVSMPIFFVLMSVAAGLTLASTILVSQNYGAKNWIGVDRVIRNSVTLTIVTSFLCVIAGHYMSDYLLRMMGTPKETLPEAISYMKIFIWTQPSMFGLFLIASILRGVGDSKTPLYFQAATLPLTAILDPLLMFGWLGCPKMGLNGTAVATIISQAIGLVAVAIYLHKKKHIASPKWNRLGADWPTTLLTIKIGVPSMFQQGLISFGMIFVVGLINHYGKDGVAAAGAAMRIDQLAFMPAMTIGMAVSTLAGQNIGAKQYGRVKEVFKSGLVLSCSITLLGTIIAVSAPRLLMRMFVQDPAVIEIGVHYLRIVGSSYIFLAIMFVSSGIINGAGHTFATSLISLVALWGVRVPLATYLSRTTNKIEGIWYAIVISFTIGMILNLIYYFSGRWKKPVKRNFSEPEIVEIQEIV